MGPALSSTSLQRHGKEVPIFAGSKSLDKVEDDESLIVHLHGHVHGAAKYDMYLLPNTVSMGSPL
jgi:Icc-related predicted phosphoesterase